MESKSSVPSISYLKYKVGDCVVIWRNNGEGIYDGNRNYVREIVNPRSSDMRYGLSDINEGEPSGYMPQGLLLSESQFQAMVNSGEIERIWTGDQKQLHDLLKRWQPEPTAPSEPLSELAALREQVAALTAEVASLEVAVNRSDLVVYDLKGVLHLPEVKAVWERIWVNYEASDDNCPLCGNAFDEPHKNDCDMPIINALVDGRYDR